MTVFRSNLRQKRRIKPRHTAVCRGETPIGSAETKTAHEICIVVAGGHVADDDAAAPGGGSVDVLAVADVDTGVGAGFARVAAGVVEEYQVAGL